MVIETRQLKTMQGTNGAAITYMDHPELHASSRIRQLLDAAETIMRSGNGAARTDESALFKALHACGYAIHKSRGENGYASRSKVALDELYQRTLEYLVSENIGLVYDMRKRARIADVDPDDLFSEGLWRLFQAVRRFDPWRGFRFSTYACTSILRGFVSLRRKKRCENDTLERLRNDSVIQEGVESGICELDNQWLAEQVRDLLLGGNAGLTPVERFVIVRRLLHPANTSPDTLQSIGEMFQLSKERIRQIQLTALEKLRLILGQDEYAPRPAPAAVETPRARTLAAQTRRSPSMVAA